MIAKFKFAALTYRGEKIYFTKKFECPDFEVIPGKEINGHKFPPTPIGIQLMDWMDRQDKSGLMDEKDLGLILDYEVFKPKKHVPLTDFIKALDLDPQVVVDMGAIYEKIKPSLKGKSNVEKTKIILSHLTVAYQAAGAAYKHMGNLISTKPTKAEVMRYEEYLQAKSENEIDDLKEFLPILNS